MRPSTASRSTGPKMIFFAPSAVRPNSPVAVEQNVNHSPSKAKHRAKAGADDRNPPSQDCSPHPGRKTTPPQTTNREEEPKMVNQEPRLTCTKQYQRIAHSDRNPVLTRFNQKTPSSQGKSRDPNLQNETSETKTKCQPKGNRLPVTFRHTKPPSLTIASQYPSSSYNRASEGMPIREALNSLAIIIMQCRIQ